MIRAYKRLQTNRTNTHMTMTYRDLKNLNKEKFIASLNEAPWDCAFVFDDADEICDAWYEIFNSIVELHLPQKQKRVKREVQPKWFTSDIAQEIKVRDKLLKKARKSQIDNDWMHYRQAKNKVTELIRKTKQSYFKNKVAENRKNPRKLWNLIKCLTKDNAESKTGVSQLKDGDVVISDKREIAEMLNLFFVKQPEELLATLIPDTQSDTSTLPLTTPHPVALKIPDITPKRVTELLLSIPVHKATGNDKLSVKLLRIAAPAIANPLCRLINHCLSTSTFPSKWKTAKVTPIFKRNGSRDEKANYRPISVLPVLSKILEKHIAQHLYNHLKDNELLHRLQSGFRKSFSTETAFLRLVDQLFFDLDHNNVTGLVFVDYKKAFDLIDHGLLLKKLESYGLTERDLNLIKNYLSGRSQFVSIDGFQSVARKVTCGVSQGSVLGPLLFIVFINDLPAAIKHSIVDIYADDTTLSSSADIEVAPQAISENLQKDLEETRVWSIKNKMVLSDSKTKCMLVTGKRLESKFSDNCSLHLKLNGTEIKQVNSQKLLGVTIDNKLSFDDHIERLCKKLTQKIAVLRKIRRFLPLEERKLYYNAMIKQSMLYGATVWTTCSADNIKKVLQLQKRAARVILRADTRANSVQLFKKLGWIPFFQEAKINKCSIIYKRLNGDCPGYIEDLLKRNCDVHSRQSRHGATNLVCPHFRRETEGGRTFTISSIRLWNSLNTQLKKVDSISSFKTALFKHFFEINNNLIHFTIS